MIRLFASVLAGILGLAFGSFLNVCVSRWPEDESIVNPRSHCRSCNRVLAWCENIPLLSWLALGGRCRTCKAWIGWRYPLVELSVGLLWAFSAWTSLGAAPDLDLAAISCSGWIVIVDGIGQAVFLWLLVALAVLDAENFWLPDKLIWPGIALGLLIGVARAAFQSCLVHGDQFAAWKALAPRAVIRWLLSSALCAGVLLVIRWTYQLFRGQQGIGLGDVKLMAMMGAWFGLRLGLLAFGIGVTLGALFALLLLAVPAARVENEKWALTRLPLGAFLCVGAIVVSFWGSPILSAYERWAGL